MIFSRKTAVIAIILFCLTSIFTSSCSRWYSNYGLTKEQLSDISSLPGLIRALDDPSPRTRQIALIYITRLRPQATEAIPKVVEIAEKDTNDNNRFYAVNFLANTLPCTPKSIKLLERIAENNFGRSADEANSAIDSMSLVITGYDREGFNDDGFDENGYDRNGCDKNGFNLRGFDQTGYDKNGFDVDGFDKQGYGKDGYNRYDCDNNGFDRQGRKKLAFKHFFLGADLREVVDLNRFYLESKKTTISDQKLILNSYCKETIADVPIKVFSLNFFDEILHSISLSFDQKNFSQVLTALTVKYGEPKTKIENIQNRMGATFENIISFWNKQDATITAKRFSFDLENSIVLFQSNFALKESARRRILHAKNTAKDL